MNDAGMRLLKHIENLKPKNVTGEGYLEGVRDGMSMVEEMIKAEFSSDTDISNANRANSNVSASDGK